MDKKIVFSQSGSESAAGDFSAVKDRFSIVLRGLVKGPFYNRSSKKNAEKIGDGSAMLFSSGTAVLADTQKPNAKESKADPSDSKTGYTPAAVASKPRDESIITKDVVINGSISAVNNIRIDGAVNGNVSCENDVTVCGNVEGDISANNVRFQGAQVKGDVTCKNSVTFDKDAVVNGNIVGKKIEINGNIKGNITVELGAAVLGGAVIVGDVTASSISVAEGAVIKGNIQISRGEMVPPSK